MGEVSERWPDPADSQRLTEPGPVDGEHFSLAAEGMSPVVRPGLERVAELRNPEQVLARAESDQPRGALSP